MLQHLSWLHGDPATGKQAQAKQEHAAKAKRREEGREAGAHPSIHPLLTAGGLACEGAKGWGCGDLSHLPSQRSYSPS